MISKNLVELNDIHFFEKNKKKDNHLYTKKRELIIYKILTNEIPIFFYKDIRWFHLKKSLLNALSEFEPFSITKKGDRRCHDFELKRNGVIVKIDFKFNCLNLSQYPQILDVVSSKLGSFCYAEYYYNYCKIKTISLPNYLSLIWQHDADTKNVFFFNLKKSIKQIFKLRNKLSLMFLILFRIILRKL